MVGGRLRGRHCERLRIVKFAPAQSSQNIASVAAGKAVEQDRPLAQAYRQAGTMIVMCRAPAFAARTAPDPTQGFDNALARWGAAMGIDYSVEVVERAEERRDRKECGSTVCK